MDSNKKVAVALIAFAGTILAAAAATLIAKKVSGKVRPDRSINENEFCKHGCTHCPFRFDCSESNEAFEPTVNPAED